MKSFKFLIVLIAMLFPVMAFAQNSQKPGFSPYECVGMVVDGQRSAGSGSVAWVKFDGNLIFFNPVGGAYPDLRYKYSGTQSDGTKVYYMQSYNTGGMGTASGWVDVYTDWLLVSPDKTSINAVQKKWDNSKSIRIYKLQNASSAGDMIY